MSKNLRVTKSQDGFTIICSPEHKEFTVSHIAKTYATKNGIPLIAVNVVRK